MKSRILPIFLSFFVMGFGDVVGTLVGFATNTFHLSRSMAGLLPFVGFIAFGVLSVPAGVLAGRRGKKFVLLLGLAVALSGMVLPMITLSRYLFLVLAILLLGSGMAILQVAGNPIMRDVSAPGRYARNLTFAQFIKAIGSLSGSVLTVFIVSRWEGLFPVYAAFIAAALVSVWVLNIEEAREGDAERPSIGSSFALLKNPYILFMVFGLFLYVGAEVGVNSWIATYLQAVYGLDIGSLATLGIGFFFLALMAGRLLGAVILNWLPANKFFLVTSLVSLAGILGLFTGSQPVAIASIFIIGLGFGNIFPLIFSILIDRFPEKSSELSGLMVMAIVGGAVMPLLMGLIADRSVMAGFLVPLGSLVFITGNALAALKKS